MTDETYNGWKNYPTWAVNLWLTNDPGSEEWAMDITRAAVDNDGPHMRYDVASELKYAVREMIENEENGGAEGMAGDLLGYALDCVDWYEIADAFIEMCEEIPA